MIIDSTFKSAWWLPNPHAQTLYPFMLRRDKRLFARPERLELPDNDFVDLVWVDGGLSTDAPVVVLLHGLSGSWNSHYIKSQMIQYKQLGWRSVVMQFRGASAEPNRQLRAYHSGDTADFNYFLHILAQREPHTKKMVVGFSLGGNVLLKWLGENSTQSLIHAAVAVSVPFQLNLCADRMNQGFSRIYRNHILKRLREHFVRKMNAYPDEEFFKTLQSCDCFWTFDDRITAPLNGFDSVHSYYRECSSKKYLHKITCPTLIVHALDDPFMTPDAVPRLADLSPSIRLELTRHGGHVGFIAGAVPGLPEFWLDKRIAEYFANHVE